MDLRTYEPELGELLDDSGVQALMRSDGIERHEVERLAEMLRRSRSAEAHGDFCTVRGAAEPAT